MTDEPAVHDDARPHIRALALGVPILHDHVLFAPVEDPVAGTRGYRPLGGGVEFGERAADAVVREFREELDRAVEVVEQIAVTENLFTYRGKPGHEVVFSFRVRFAGDGAPADLAPLSYFEPSRGTRLAYWLPLAEVIGGMHTVYPHGFEESLARWINRL